MIINKIAIIYEILISEEDKVIPEGSTFMSL